MLPGGARTGVRERHGPQQIGDQTPPRGEGAACAQQVAEIGFEIGGEAGAELARIQTEQEAIGRLRPEEASTHQPSSVMRCFDRRSAASRAQTLRLAIECAPAEGLQGEHAPTIVAARVELTDESGFFHALQRAVDRARAHPHLLTGGLFDRLHDGVAVPRTIRQREQDVEHGRRQGRLTEGWDRRLGHGSTLITVTDI